MPIFLILSVLFVLWPNNHDCLSLKVCHVGMILLCSYIWIFGDHITHHIVMGLGFFSQSWMIIHVQLGSSWCNLNPKFFSILRIFLPWLKISSINPFNEFALIMLVNSWTKNFPHYSPRMASFVKVCVSTLLNKMGLLKGNIVIS